MYKTLIYISKPTFEFDTAQLFNILKAAQRNNGILEITGYLIYKEEYFMQYLEGEPERVDSLYARIGIDTRHIDIYKIYEGLAEQRMFPDWKMGFSSMSFWKKAKIEGFDAHVNPIPLPLPQGSDQEVIHKILKTFGEN